VVDPVLDSWRAKAVGEVKEEDEGPDLDQTLTRQTLLESWGGNARKPPAGAGKLQAFSPSETTKHPSIELA
jgi:hypothetical protein